MDTETEKKPAKEKLKEGLEKIKTAVGKVSKVVWIIIGIALLAILAGIIIFLNTRPYSILVTGASPSEVTTVTTWLEGRGVTDYRVQGNNTVLVPDRMATALKAALLSEQYTDGDYDFSGYFDNVSMLSTESERNNAMEIAVNEKLAAVISQMDGVEWASVTITPGEDLSYVLDTGRVVDASASVLVRTRDGGVLDDGVAQAIRGYVSHAVQGLNIDNVVLYDTNGGYYADVSAGNKGGSADNSLLKLQLEQNYANELTAKAMNILRPLFGEDNVKCSVAVTIELNTTDITENETYIPEYIDEEHRGAGMGLIGRKAWDYRYDAPAGGTEGGVIGTEVNSDIPTNVEDAANDAENPDQVDSSGQTDYNNPTRETHTYRDVGYITDCTVSVSVNSSTAQELNIEGLRQHVANAIGLTPMETETLTAAEYLASKVSVYSGPFYQPQTIVPGPWDWWPFNDIIPGWIVLAAGAGLLLFLILLIIIIFAAKRHKKKKLAAAALAEEEAQQAALEEAEEERREAEAALAEAMGMPQAELVGADVMSLQTEKSMELRQDIRQFVEENPEVAAQLLKTWLRGGEDHG